MKYENLFRSALWVTAAAHFLGIGSGVFAQSNPPRLEGTVQSGPGDGADGDGACHEGWAACGVWHHDQKTTGKYRLAAMDCYASLGRALDWEDEAFELNEQLRDTVGRARVPLHERFTEKISQRQAELEAHRQCIADWYAAHRELPENPTENEETPAVTEETPPGSSWAEQLDAALGNIPHLKDIDKFLADASDFDMTKPHTGAKVVLESALNLLGEAGFSYLAKGLRPLLAKAATTAAGDAATGAAAGAAREAAAASGAATGRGTIGRSGAAAAGGTEGAAGGALGESAAGGALGGRGTAGAAESAPSRGALGNPGREAAQEVGPPPRHQPASSRYTDTEPPMYRPQGVKRYQHVDAPPPRTSIGEQIIPEQVWAAQLPPGTEIPAAIRSLPRPVYLQESTHSCVLACSKMISETHLGASFPENAIERMVRATGDAYVPGVGTTPERVREVLWQSGGIQSRLETNVTIDDLAAATANGAPAMVGLRGEHAVIVDGIVDTATGPMVLVRDPANLGLVHSDLARDNAVRAGFTNAPAVPLQDFMRDFFAPGTQTGVALFTQLR